MDPAGPTVRNQAARGPAPSDVAPQRVRL